MSQVDFKKPEKDIDAELPVIPVGWRILVRPFEPKDTWGDTDLVIADEAMESEKLLTCVGQIAAMGDLCFKAKTRSGIDLSDMTPKPKVGDWIIYGTYGGQTIHTKAGAKYLLMNDDGIMGFVKDPNAIRAYI